MTTTHPPSIRLRMDRVAVLRDMRDLKEDKALAIAMGVSPSTVSRVLNGKSEPGTYFIASLCHALEAPVDKLVILDPPLPMVDARRAA